MEKQNRGPILINRFFILGFFLGYPPCCIISFLEDIGPILEGLRRGVRARPKRKLCGSGYVPCIECNKKTIPELVARINEKRILQSPFPCEIPKLSPEELILEIKKAGLINELKDIQISYDERNKEKRSA